MKIAYIAADGLGDGVIQILIAQNLAKAGYQVTYYQDLLFSLDSIVKAVQVKASSLIAEKQDELSDYDVLLVDKGFKFCHQILTNAHLSEKTLVYSMSKTRSRNKNDYINQFSGQDRALLSLFNAGYLRCASQVGTIVDQVNFLFKKAGFSNPDYNIALNVPESWQVKHNDKRVIMHPVSSCVSKNWHSQGYLQLAERLSKHGFEPVFSMTDVEAKQWQQDVNCTYPVFVVDSIYELAKYYYESALFIGNDSGNGHLASMMGLDTITIINSRKKNFSWRPAWGRNQLVRPVFSRRLVGKKAWKKYIYADKVYNLVETITNKN